MMPPIEATLYFREKNTITPKKTSDLGNCVPVRTHSFSLVRDRKIQTFITTKSITEPAEMTKHGFKLLRPLAEINLSHETSFLRGIFLKKVT